MTRHASLLSLALVPLVSLAVADGPFPGMSPGLSAPPTLKIEAAIYQLEPGVLQYGFSFVNPSDSALFLDCQVPPRATLSGGVLTLDFDRKSMPASGTAGAAPGSAGDSGKAAPDSGAVAGGPVAGTANPEDFPPQRIGPNQTFQGQRRLDRVLGDSQARPKFSSLRLRMAFYPERTSGEGGPFVEERQLRVVSQSVPVTRRGKAPPPPKVLKYRVPAPG